MNQMSEVLNYFRDTSREITDSFNRGQISEEEAVTNYILLGCLILGIDTDIPVEMQKNILQDRIDRAVLLDLTEAEVS
ncbi:MAG: hypothetical protein K6D03_00490 [Solobacterium sp.]|nr:hypothetical protein [Solobacterium sp.]